MKNMAIEREIRFRVTEGQPPKHRGRELRQLYLLRYPATLRVRLPVAGGATLTLKWPRDEGSYEWEYGFPVALARWLFRLPLPRVEKVRFEEGELEVDVFSWPRSLVLIECELPPEGGPRLGDVQARVAWMERRRPAWVRAWEDVTGNPAYANAELACVRHESRRL